MICTSTLHISAYIHILRSRPPRRTCSAYLSTSQPFSARNCRRENYWLGKRTFPKFFAFFAFCGVLFVFSFYPVFSFFVVSRFSSYEYEYEYYWCTFWAFFPFRIIKSRVSSFFPFRSIFFLSVFRYKSRERTRPRRQQ